MPISTEAPTMPSITHSNYRPLTRLGLEYELFVARMSHSNDIELTNGTLTRGYPKFGGLHLSFEPVSGWALGAQRIIVWGGGAAGGQSFKDILKAFFNPSRAQSTGFGNNVHVIGKQEGGVSSRFIFPGRTPFAVYFEYAGNDTVQGHAYLLGKPDLSAGIHFPHLGPFDLTFEASQWEPTWYVHHRSSVETGYGDVITTDRLNIGHWFGDQRLFGDAVGGRSNMLRIGFEPPFGGLLEAEYRMLVNDSYYSAIPYRHENLGSLSYSHPWREYAVGVEVDAGRDVFGGSFTRVAGFLRYGDALRSGYAESLDESFAAERAEGSELYVDAGVTTNRVQQDVLSLQPRTTTPSSSGAHPGVGARRRRPCAQRPGTAADAERAAAHHLEELRAPAELGDEAVDFGLARSELDDEAVGRRIEHAPAAAYHVPTHGIGVRGIDLEPQQHELALEMLAARHVEHAHDIDELVELIDDLLDDLIGPLRDQRQSGYRRIVGRSDRQRLDVVAAGGEQTGDPGQGAGFVLQKDGDDVAHAERVADSQNKGSP